METERTNTLTLLLLEEADIYNRWIFEQVKPYLKGNILEVGCGIGNLTGWLLEQGKVLATDVNEEYLKIILKKYRGHHNLMGTQVWDIRENYQIGMDRVFDTIVCSNVLEHVEDDDIVLSHLYELLPKGGRLILLVPALKILYNHLDRELGHFRRYDKGELIQKLKRHRFRIDHLTYFNFFGILGWFLNGTLLKRRLLPERQMGIFNKMVPYFKIAERMIPARVGQSLIAIGEK